jgi:hypothetical protein
MKPEYETGRNQTQTTSHLSIPWGLFMASLVDHVPPREMQAKVLLYTMHDMLHCCYLTWY